MSFDWRPRASKPARRQEPPEQNHDGNQTVIENRISRPRREVHNLKKPKTDPEEAWLAQHALLLMFHSKNRLPPSKNQIRRNGRRSSFSVVIFTG
jgi:hypothetical protein